MGKAGPFQGENSLVGKGERTKSRSINRKQDMGEKRLGKVARARVKNPGQPKNTNAISGVGQEERSGSPGAEEAGWLCMACACMKKPASRHFRMLV